MCIFGTPPAWYITFIYAWLCSSKITYQLVALIDMKLHAPNQLYTSIYFWDKFLKASFSLPGHVRSHAPKHNQFITLIDMKLHAQNHLYMYFCFWDLKVLIASLGDVLPCYLKSHHQCLALINMYIQTKNPLYNSNSFWGIKL